MAVRVKTNYMSEYIACEVTSRKATKKGHKTFKQRLRQCVKSKGNIIKYLF